MRKVGKRDPDVVASWELLGKAQSKRKGLTSKGTSLSRSFCSLLRSSGKLKLYSADMMGDVRLLASWRRERKEIVSPYDVGGPDLICLVASFFAGRGGVPEAVGWSEWGASTWSVVGLDCWLLFWDV